MPINTVSDVLGHQAAPTEWEASNGSKYQLSLITLKSQSKIEKFIERDAIESISAHREVIGEDEYHRQITKILKEISQGRYNFGGEYCQNALETMKGVSALVAVIFNVDRDHAMELLATEEEIKDVVQMITERSFQKKIISKQKTEE